MSCINTSRLWVLRSVLVLEQQGFQECTRLCGISMCFVDQQDHWQESLYVLILWLILPCPQPCWPGQKLPNSMMMRLLQKVTLWESLLQMLCKSASFCLETAICKSIALPAHVASRADNSNLCKVNGGDKRTNWHFFAFLPLRDLLEYSSSFEISFRASILWRSFHRSLYWNAFSGPFLETREVAMDSCSLQASCGEITCCFYLPWWFVLHKP